MRCLKFCIVPFIVAATDAFGQHSNNDLLNIAAALADNSTSYIQCRVNLEIADIYKDLGDSINRVKCIDKVVSLNDQTDLCIRLLALALFDLGRREEALNYINNRRLYLGSGDRNDEMVLSTAGLLARAGEFGLAKTFLDSTKTNYIKGKINDAIAISYLNKGMIDSAKATSQRAVQDYTRPKELRDTFSRYINAGKLDSACLLADSIKYYPWKGEEFYEALDSLIAKGRSRKVLPILSAVVDTLKPQMAREKFWCGAWAGGFVRELMTIAVLRNKSGDKSGSKRLMAFVGNPLDKAKLSEECYPEYEFNEVSATANVAGGYFNIGDSLKAVDILDSLIQYFNNKSYTAKYDKHNDRESILSGYISINMLSKVESLLSDEPFYYFAATELLNKYMELGQYKNALALISKSKNNGSRAIAIMNMYEYLEKMSDSLDDSEWAIVRSFVNALAKDID